MDKKQTVTKTPSKATETPVIFLLPSEATKVLVQLKPSLTISAFLPSQEREITFFDDEDFPEEETLSLTTPPLVLSQKMRASESGPVASGAIYLNSVTCREENFRTKPYTLFNVGSDGSICFGDGDSPKSLRMANAYFWGSSFNTDLQSNLAYKKCECVPRKKKIHDWANCDIESGERKRLRQPNLKCKNQNCDCCRDACPCTPAKCPCPKGVDLNATYCAFVKRHKKLAPILNTIRGTDYLLHPQPAEGVAIITKNCGLKLPKAVWRPTTFPGHPTLAIGFVKSLPSDNYLISFIGSNTTLTLPAARVTIY